MPEATRDRPELRAASGQIEITPSMLAAGISALERTLGSAEVGCSTDFYDVAATQVFRAMVAAAQSSPEGSLVSS